MTLADLTSYEAHLVEPLKFTLSGNKVLMTAPPPAGGALLGMVLGE